MIYHFTKHFSWVINYGKFASNVGDLSIYNISPITCDHCGNIYTLLIYNYDSNEYFYYVFYGNINIDEINQYKNLLTMINEIKEKEKALELLEIISKEIFYSVLSYNSIKEVIKKAIDGNIIHL